MLSHKAVLSDLICSRDEIQADGRIVSTPQQDSIEVFRDHRNKFRPDNVYTTSGKSLFDVNNGFRTVEPTDYHDGLLPRAYISLPAEQHISAKSESLADFSLRAFDVYNGMFDLKHWNTGETFELEHKFDSGRLPAGSFAGMQGLPYNKTRLALCNKLLDTVWGIQANMATQINRAPILPAPICFLRFAPVWTASGRMKRRAQFKCKYTTTIEFFFSPDAGINMFQFGEQPEIQSYPFDDPYDQCRASIDRFNWGVHAEDFVMPLTAYVLEEQEISDKIPLEDRKTSLADQKARTLTKRTEDTLRASGYTIDVPYLENGRIVTRVEPLFEKPATTQLKPQYSDANLLAEGLEQTDIDAMHEMFETTEDSNTVKYTRNDKGLLTDTAGKPILPVTVRDDITEQSVFNTEYLKPKEVWQLLGVEDPTPFSRMENGVNRRFIPWPKMGPYGKTFGRNFCRLKERYRRGQKTE